MPSCKRRGVVGSETLTGSMKWERRSNLRVGVQKPWVEEHSIQADGMWTRTDDESLRGPPSKAGQMHPCNGTGTEVFTRPENHTPILSADPDRLPDAGHLHPPPTGEVAAALMPPHHGKRYSPERAETSARP